MIVTVANVVWSLSMITVWFENAIRWAKDW